MCNSEQERRYQASQGGKFAQYTTSASVDQFEPYKAPMIRLEKQPGYVDVVYARETQQGSDSQSENLKAAGSSVDPRVYGLEEIMKVHIDNRPEFVKIKKYAFLRESEIEVAVIIIERSAAR